MAALIALVVLMLIALCIVLFRAVRIIPQARAAVVERLAATAARWTPGFAS